MLCYALFAAREDIVDAAQNYKNGRCEHETERTQDASLPLPLPLARVVNADTEHGYDTLQLQ